MAISPETKWKDVPLGGMIPQPGTSAEYETGNWRTFRPIHSQDKCINCLRCWILCPDSAIQVEEGKVVGIDYAHCKGCGICAFECPDKVKAIDMKLESDCLKEESEANA